MQPPQQNAPNLFVDSIICGVIGGGIAVALGRHIFLWAMLCAVVGPLFILFANRLTEALPDYLSARNSGVYEFAAFALTVFILALFAPFAR